MRALLSLLSLAACILAARAQATNPVTPVAHHIYYHRLYSSLDYNP
jgi:hypothetical protein